MSDTDHEQECENPGEVPTASMLQIENLFLIERAGKAEARCKRLLTALHKVRDVRKKLVYFKDDFCLFEDGKRAWRLLEEMEAALSDTAQPEADR